MSQMAMSAAHGGIVTVQSAPEQKPPRVLFPVEEGSAPMWCGKPGCDKPAELCCPFCVELEIGPSGFCSTTCLEASWKKHRVQHGEEKCRTCKGIHTNDFQTEVGHSFDLRVIRSMFFRSSLVAAF